MTSPQVAARVGVAACMGIHLTCVAVCFKAIANGKLCWHCRKDKATTNQPAGGSQRLLAALLAHPLAPMTTDWSLTDPSPPKARTPWITKKLWYTHNANEAYIMSCTLVHKNYWGCWSPCIKPKDAQIFKSSLQVHMHNFDRDTVPNMVHSCILPKQGGCLWLPGYRAGSKDTASQTLLTSRGLGARCIKVFVKLEVQHW